MESATQSSAHHALSMEYPRNDSGLVSSERVLDILQLILAGSPLAEVLMGCVQIAMLGRMPYTALRDAILAHPTIPEGLIALFSTAPS